MMSLKGVYNGMNQKINELFKADPILLANTPTQPCATPLRASYVLQLALLVARLILHIENTQYYTNLCRYRGKRRLMQRQSSLQIISIFRRRIT